MLRPLVLAAGLCAVLTQPAASSVSDTHSAVLLSLSFSGILSVSLCVDTDDGHVEMGGFLERLSARIDGRELPLPPPPPPPPPPPTTTTTTTTTHRQPPPPEAHTEPPLETLPVRLNKINPDLSRKTAGVTERTINLVDSTGKEGRYKLRQDLPNGGYSIVTEEGKKVDLNELQLGSHKKGAGGDSTASNTGPPAVAPTTFAGIGAAEQARIRKAIADFDEQRELADADEDEAVSSRAGGRKKRRAKSGGEGGLSQLRQVLSSPPPSSTFAGSGAYPPRPAPSPGVAVQRYASGPARSGPTSPAAGKAAKRHVERALDEEWLQFQQAPVGAHQWQDEGAKLYLLVQISAVDVLRTTVDIRRDEVRVMTWNILGQPIKCHVGPLYGAIVPKHSYWEMAERGGIDIALHKREPDVAWPQLLRTEIDPIALGE